MLKITTRLAIFILAYFTNNAKCIEEIVQLDIPGIAKTIGLPIKKSPNLDHQWVLKSKAGTKISLQCEIALKMEKDGVCDKNVMTLNDGLNEEKLCSYKTFNVISQKNLAKVRIQLDETGGGRMKCLVQSVTGPNANEFENIIQKDIDSSEFGVKTGIKKTSCDCGRANKKQSRILNGQEINENEFPWLVQLHILHEFGPFKFPVSCGASILTHRHVLTAAHCVVSEQTNLMTKPTNIIIVIAEHDMDKKTKNEQFLSGEKIFVSDLYMEKGLEYDDIAIIYTKETIKYNRLVGPICIEKKPYNILHKQLDIMGWGMTETGQASKVPLKSKATVMDLSVCGMKPWDVCTSTSPSSLCVGDSGGPLVMVDPETNRYTQIALVSKVRPDCKGGVSASTLVSYYYDWIQQIINETEPSFATCHKL